MANLGAAFHPKLSDVFTGPFGGDAWIVHCDNKVTANANTLEACEFACLYCEACQRVGHTDERAATLGQCAPGSHPNPQNHNNCEPDKTG